MTKTIVVSLTLLALVCAEPLRGYAQSQAEKTGTGAAAGQSARPRSAGPGLQIGIVAATVVAAAAIGGIVVLLGGTGGDDSGSGGTAAVTSTSSQ